MATFLISIVLTLLSTVYCAKYTVTDEVWFDVMVKDMDGPGKDFKGRFVIGVFADVAPMTSLNFVSLAKGHKGLHYKGSPVHRVVQDFVVQTGDITTKDGTGGRSIFGNTFEDEDFVLSHRGPGWVAMANHGRHTNASQFYIMLTKARWLDGRHVVFGKVVRGFEVVDMLANLEADDQARPLKQVTIVDCGVNDMDKRYTLQGEQLDNTEDIGPVEQ